MAETSSTSGPETAAQRVVIKKYANRRLYNTASSSYVTLEHLAEMVKKGVDFVVYDAKTNEDITRTVLTQIIFEEEEKSQGQSLLPIQFLRQLISYYGNSMQAFLPSYLELSLSSFAQQQERLRTQFAGIAPVAGVGAGMGAYEDQVRQNLQLFDRAMKMFSPFAFTPGAATAAGGAKAEETPAPAAAQPAAAKPQPAPESDDSLSLLRKQMLEMQAQIDRLANKE